MNAPAATPPLASSPAARLGFDPVRVAALAISRGAIHHPKPDAPPPAGSNSDRLDRARLSARLYASKKYAANHARGLTCAGRPPKNRCFAQLRGKFPNTPAGRKLYLRAWRKINRAGHE